jgi:hypothetical protein
LGSAVGIKFRYIKMGVRVYQRKDIIRQHTRRKVMFYGITGGT